MNDHNMLDFEQGLGLHLAKNLDHPDVSFCASMTRRCLKHLCS